MNDKNYDEAIKKITRLILTNQQRMIREADLKNICDTSFDFDQIINDVYQNLKSVGFEMITTKFLEQKYFVLTSEGKDDTITPSQYGTLALILALSNEVDENIKFSDLKEMFSEVWKSDIEFLLESDYLRQINIDNLDIVKITPLGKATLKNVIQTLKLKNIINIFK